VKDISLSFIENRPFVIKTENARITVVGTKFNVKSEDEKNKCRRSGRACKNCPEELMNLKRLISQRTEKALW